MAARVPLVDYLVLDEGPPHLRVNECLACGARFFDRRNACAACFEDSFSTVDLPTAGEVVAYTIVSHAGRGIPVPFVAATVDCGGTKVKANIINIEADPDHVQLGMAVQLSTYVLGTDSAGTEAIAFGFEPAGTHRGTTAHTTEDR